jgi:hypothetical protein
MNDRLPANWHTLSLGALWDRLNDPRRFSTPQSTVEAILYCVQQRGLAALDEPANIQRLASCDAAALKIIDERIERLMAAGKIAA